MKHIESTKKVTFEPIQEGLVLHGGYFLGTSEISSLPFNLISFSLSVYAAHALSINFVCRASFLLPAPAHTCTGREGGEKVIKKQFR